MSPLGTDRTNSPSEKVTGSIPESHSCHVVSDTWSRSDPVHLVQRSPAWVTASSERPFSPLGVQPACSERSSVWVIGRTYTVPAGATRGHRQIGLTWADSPPAAESTRRPRHGTCDESAPDYRAAVAKG